MTKKVKARIIFLAVFVIVKLILDYFLFSNKIDVKNFVVALFTGFLAVGIMYFIEKKK